MKKKKILTKAYRILLVFLLTVSSLALGSEATTAATMPDYTSLGTVAGITGRPTVVSLDTQGRLYIAEPMSRRVSIYTQSGHYVASLKNVGSPNSVAVDANGKIFVGDSETGNVTAYGSDLKKLFTLGSGANFGLRFDITTDSAGHVYVADKENNTVFIYNGINGSLITSLSALAGTATLNHPVSVAIDEAASELIILDRMVTPDLRSIDPWIDGAGIHFFKISTDPETGVVSWIWDRSFDKFGNAPNRDSGEMKMPGHVAVHAVGGESIIYVTDRYVRPVAMVYESTTGQYLGNIPVSGRNDMTIGSTNLMYVASVRHDTLEVYGLGSFSASLAAPSSLAYTATEGGNDPQPQTMTIKNLGNTELDWTATPGETWITMASTTDTLPASAESAVDVNVIIDGLAPGTYNGKINITSGAGVTDHITVSLKIKPTPLVVAPGSITIVTAVGTTPSSRTLSVTNMGKEALNFKAAADQDWISLSSDTGTAPDDIKVYVDVSQLAAGTHDGIITFTRDDGAYPVEVPVSLTLEESGDQPPVDVPELPAPGSKGIKIDGKHWRVTQVLDGNTNLNGVWGANRRVAFVVGDNGTIMQRNGKKWTQMTSSVTTALNSVWGSSKDNVYAVGDAGTMLQYNGTDWAAIRSETLDLQDVWGENAETAKGSELRTIWGSSATDIFAAGEAGTVLHSVDGSNWTKMTSNTSQWLNSLWGSSDTDVFAVGENGTIIHYNGTEWSAMESGTTETLNGVWGSSENDVFAVGANAIVLHYDGTDWQTVMAGGTDISLNDVWASNKSLVIAVGDDGIILTAKKAKYDWQKILVIIAENAKKQKKKGQSKK